MARNMAMTGASPDPPATNNTGASDFLAYEAHAVYMLGKDSTGHAAYKKLHRPMGIWRRGKRIAARDTRERRQANLRKLAWLVVQRAIELQAQTLNVVGQGLLHHHSGTALLHRQRLGLLNFNAHRPHWHALAGQNCALRQLLFREQVAGLSELSYFSFHQTALAGGTAAHTATVRKVDPLSQCCGQNGLARQHPDRLGIDGGRRTRRIELQSEHAASSGLRVLRCRCGISRFAKPVNRLYSPYFIGIFADGAIR